MTVLYTVWCGGVEVNDYHLDNYDDARKLAQQFIDDDYDDVHIQRINKGDNQ